LPFLFRVVFRSAPAKLAIEITHIRVVFIGVFKLLMQSTRMLDSAGGAIATEATFWEQLELVMVGMTCY
jgi:hypothetical protein